MSEALQTVKFIRSCSPYTVGEIASFKPDIARKLYNAGACEFVVKEKTDDDDKSDDDNREPTAARASGQADAGAGREKPKGRVRVR
jgi:hypothetical protein